MELSSRGKTDLPIDRFRIPMMVYAPKHVAPQRIDYLASQTREALAMTVSYYQVASAAYRSGALRRAGRSH